MLLSRAVLRSCARVTFLGLQRVKRAERDYSYGRGPGEVSDNEWKR